MCQQGECDEKHTQGGPMVAHGVFKVLWFTKLGKFFHCCKLKRNKKVV